MQRDTPQPAEPPNDLGTPGLLQAAESVLARCGPGGFVAVELGAGGAISDVDAATPRVLLGWTARPGSCAAAAAFRTATSARGHAVARSGAEAHTSPGEDPVLWMLRRSLGRPSGATHREAGEVAEAVVLTELCELARRDRVHVVDAVRTASVRELVLTNPVLAAAAAPLVDQSGWAELHRRAQGRSPLSAWCDTDLFAYLSGHAVPGADDAAASLEEVLGAELAVLVRDQLAGPW